MYETVMSTDDLKQPSKKSVGFDEVEILEMIGRAFMPKLELDFVFPWLFSLIIYSK